VQIMLDDPRPLFDQFVPKARAYVESPGVMAALELDGICERLYPLVARKLGDTALSNRIRDFGRGLPRKGQEELRVLFEEILVLAEEKGLVS
jgi:hypothetical protein